MTADLSAHRRRIEDDIEALERKIEYDDSYGTDELRAMIQELSQLQQKLRTIEAQRRGEGILQWRT